MQVVDVGIRLEINRCQTSVERSHFSTFYSKLQENNERHDFKCLRCIISSTKPNLRAVGLLNIK